MQEKKVILFLVFSLDLTHTYTRALTLKILFVFLMGARKWKWCFNYIPYIKGGNYNNREGENNWILSPRCFQMLFPHGTQSLQKLLKTAKSQRKSGNWNLIGARMRKLMRNDGNKYHFVIFHFFFFLRNHLSIVTDSDENNEMIRVLTPWNFVRGKILRLFKCNFINIEHTPASKRKT